MPKTFLNNPISIEEASKPEPFHYSQGFLGNLGFVLNRPTKGVQDLLSGHPGRAVANIGQFFAELATLGYAPNNLLIDEKDDQQWGLLADIFLDPLLYVGLPTNAIEKVGVKTAGMLDKVLAAGSKGIESVSEIKRGLQVALQDTAHALVKYRTPQLAKSLGIVGEDTAKMGAKVAELLKEDVDRLFREGLKPTGKELVSNVAEKLSSKTAIPGIIKPAFHAGGTTFGFDQIAALLSLDLFGLVPKLTGGRSLRSALSWLITPLEFSKEVPILGKGIPVGIASEPIAKLLGKTGKVAGKIPTAGPALEGLFSGLSKYLKVLTTARSGPGRIALSDFTYNLPPFLLMKNIVAGPIGRATAKAFSKNKAETEIGNRLTHRYFIDLAGSHQQAQRDLIEALTIDGKVIPVEEYQKYADIYGKKVVDFLQQKMDEVGIKQTIYTPEIANEANRIAMEGMPEWFGKARSKIERKLQGLAGISQKGKALQGYSFNDNGRVIINAINDAIDVAKNPAGRIKHTFINELLGKYLDAGQPVTAFRYFTLHEHPFELLNAEGETISAIKGLNDLVKHEIQKIADKYGVKLEELGNIGPIIEEEQAATLMRTSVNRNKDIALNRLIDESKDKLGTKLSSAIEAWRFNVPQLQEGAQTFEPTMERVGSIINDIKERADVLRDPEVARHFQQRLATALRATDKPELANLIENIPDGKTLLSKVKEMEAELPNLGEQLNITAPAKKLTLKDKEIQFRSKEHKGPGTPHFNAGDAEVWREANDAQKYGDSFLSNKIYDEYKKAGIHTPEGKTYGEITRATARLAEIIKINKTLSQEPFQHVAEMDSLTSIIRDGIKKLVGGAGKETANLSKLRAPQVIQGEIRQLSEEYKALDKFSPQRKEISKKIGELEHELKDSIAEQKQGKRFGPGTPKYRPDDFEEMPLKNVTIGMLRKLRENDFPFIVRVPKGGYDAALKAGVKPSEMALEPITADEMLKLKQTIMKRLEGKKEAPDLFKNMSGRTLESKANNIRERLNKTDLGKIERAQLEADLIRTQNELKGRPIDLKKDLEFGAKTVYREADKAARELFPDAPIKTLYQHPQLKPLGRKLNELSDALETGEEAAVNTAIDGVKAEIKKLGADLDKPHYGPGTPNAKYVEQRLGRKLKKEEKAVLTEIIFRTTEGTPEAIKRAYKKIAEVSKTDMAFAQSLTTEMVKRGQFADKTHKMAWVNLIRQVELKKAYKHARAVEKGAFDLLEKMEKDAGFFGQAQKKFFDYEKRLKNSAEVKKYENLLHLRVQSTDTAAMLKWEMDNLGGLRLSHDVISHPYLAVQPLIAGEDLTRMRKYLETLQGKMEYINYNLDLVRRADIEVRRVGSTMLPDGGAIEPIMGPTFHHTTKFKYVRKQVSEIRRLLNTSIKNGGFGPTAKILVSKKMQMLEDFEALFKVAVRNRATAKAVEIMADYTDLAKNVAEQLAREGKKFGSRVIRPPSTEFLRGFKKLVETPKQSVAEMAKTLAETKLPKAIQDVLDKIPEKDKLAEEAIKRLNLDKLIKKTDDIEAALKSMGVDVAKIRPEMAIEAEKSYAIKEIERAMKSGDVGGDLSLAISKRKRAEKILTQLEKGGAEASRISKQKSIIKDLDEEIKDIIKSSKSGIRKGVGISQLEAMAKDINALEKAGDVEKAAELEVHYNKLIKLRNAVFAKKIPSRFVREQKIYYGLFNEVDNAANAAIRRHLEKPFEAMDALLGKPTTYPKEAIEEFAATIEDVVGKGRNADIMKGLLLEGKTGRELAKTYKLDPSMITRVKNKYLEDIKSELFKKNNIRLRRGAIKPSTGEFAGPKSYKNPALDEAIHDFNRYTNYTKKWREELLAAVKDGTATPEDIKAFHQVRLKIRRLRRKFAKHARFNNIKLETSPRTIPGNTGPGTAAARKISSVSKLDLPMDRMLEGFIRHERGIGIKKPNIIQRGIEAFAREWMGLPSLIKSVSMATAKGDPTKAIKIWTDSKFLRSIIESNLVQRGGFKALSTVGIGPIIFPGFHIRNALSAPTQALFHRFGDIEMGTRASLVGLTSAIDGAVAVVPELLKSISSKLKLKPLEKLFDLLSNIRPTTRLSKLSKLAWAHSFNKLDELEKVKIKPIQLEKLWQPTSKTAAGYKAAVKALEEDGWKIIGGDIAKREPLTITKKVTNGKDFMEIAEQYGVIEGFASSEIITKLGKRVSLAGGTGQAVETGMRLTMWKHFLEQGMNQVDASILVREILYDYSTLGSADRTVRALFPFGKFTMEAVPSALKTLKERPGIINLLRKTVGHGDNSEIRMKFDGKTYGVGVSNILDTLAIFGSEEGARRTLEKDFGMASPVITGPIQLIAGRSFWRGRKLTVWNIIGMVPGIRAVSIVNQLSGDAIRSAVQDTMKRKKESFMKRLIPVLTGLRPRQIDLKKEALRDIRNYLYHILESPTETGLWEYRNLVTTDTASPELIQILKKYNGMRKK